MPRSSYEPLHKREINTSVVGVKRQVAQIITGEKRHVPQRIVEKAPRYLTPQPRGLRAVAALALATGLAVSFNGARDVSKPATPYVDTSVDCLPRGFQKVSTPQNPLNNIEDIFSSIQLTGDLEAGDCIDELYDYVAVQVRPQFAMDTELGFTAPNEIVLPRFYTPKQ